MSASLATGGLFRAYSTIIGGAPPVHQYEVKEKDFPVFIKVKKVKLLDSKKNYPIKINIGRVN